MWAIHKVIYLLRNKKKKPKKWGFIPFACISKRPSNRLINIEVRTYLVNNSMAFTILITIEDNKAIGYHRFPA